MHRLHRMHRETPVSTYSRIRRGPAAAGWLYTTACPYAEGSHGHRGRVVKVGVGSRRPANNRLQPAGVVCPFCGDHNLPDGVPIFSRRRAPGESVDVELEPDSEPSDG